MIVENVIPRGQQNYGRIFKPQADQRKYRSHFAVIEGTDTGAFDSGRDIQDVGIPIGKSGATLKFEEFKDSKGGTNDKFYGGRRVREYVVPIEEARIKEKREGQESTDDLDQFLGRTVDRQTDGGLSGMKGELTSRLQSSYAPAANVPVTTAPAKTTVGWTPERRARQEATLAKKKSQTQPTTA